MRLKKAFTMVELLIVIVILAILASYSIPRFKRDTRSEAINHILTMIRYTQNLALHDTKHSIDSTNWQRSFWRFSIYKCRNSNDLFYKIGTDKDYNKGINRAETAIDPSNNKFTFWDTRKPCPINTTDALADQVSPNIFLTRKYGIKSVNFSSCMVMTNAKKTSSYEYIGFDNFGRPIMSYLASIKPSYWGYMVSKCQITFNFTDNSTKPFTIIVEPESGYTHLAGDTNNL